MISIILNLMVVNAFAAKPLYDIPKCYRPKDFSVGKLVSSYEACLARQKSYCLGHTEIKNCGSFQSTGKPYYKVAADEIDPTKRCRITKDGSYVCLQDPIKLVLPEEPHAEPVASPIASPNGSPTGSPQPGIDTGAPRSVEVPVDDSSTGTRSSPGGLPRSNLPKGN
jgi:hypothetical protein